MNNVADITIEQNSMISLHVQLHNQLRQLITSERWPHGSRIPSESQFVQHLNLSRSTVRLGLQRAEIEGLIERRAGRGTFVKYTHKVEVDHHLIGFVTYGLDAECHLLLLNGAESEVKARGYQIIFNNVANQQEELTLLQRLSAQNVAGILLWPNAAAAHSNQDIESPYDRIVPPIVLMDRAIHGFECDLVTSDNYGGAHALMRHLVEMGHHHIAFLSHREMDVLPVQERYRAYTDVLTEAGATPLEAWQIGQPGVEITATMALRASMDPNNALLQQLKEYFVGTLPRPTAIFAINDYLAVLALRAVRLLGWQVPEDISIAGFDDTDYSLHVETPLTTVSQDYFAIGKRAAQTLIDRIEGELAGHALTHIIPTQLRTRTSTSLPVHA